MTTRHLLDPSMVGLGMVPGCALIDFVGHNPDVDTGGTLPESVWSAGGLRSLRAAAAICEVVSSDAADDGSPAGTGARTILIEGLDGDYEPVSEVITLNGITAVDGTQLFLRINKVTVLTVGSGGTNAGNITIRDNAAGTTREYITAGDGESQSAAYCVPAGHVLLLDNWYMTAKDASGSSVAVAADFRVTKYGMSSTVPWSVLMTGTFGTEFRTPHVIPEKADFEMRVTAVGGNDTVVNYHGHAILVNKAMFP